MKTAESFKLDQIDNKVVHKRTFDVEPAIKQVKALRDAGLDKSDVGGLSDSKLVARIPAFLITEILKEAGIGWDDPASGDVVMRALQSGEYDHFRVWGGNLGTGA